MTSRANNNMLLHIILLRLACLVVWNTYNGVRAQTLRANLDQYAFGTPIELSWNYASKYPDGQYNFDILGIVYENIIPDKDNIGRVLQMYVYVSTLTQELGTSPRNVGTVTFDGNDPIESNFQAWPLLRGFYRAYLLNQDDGSTYAVSDTIYVFQPTISTNKPTYFVNEPITFFWEYTSTFTGTGARNRDGLGLYDATVVNLDVFNPIMGVWVSTLRKDGAPNSTIRNSGMVTFDSQPPNETGSQSWPLQAGSYKAILVNLDGPRNYAESKTFVVVPAPTKAPTKAPTQAPTKFPTKAPTKVPTKEATKTPTKLPTKAPTKAPAKLPTKVPSKAATNTPTKVPTKTTSKAPSTNSPSVAPTRNEKQLFCNIFILRNIFCSDRCGFIGRLLKTCKTAEE